MDYISKLRTLGYLASPTPFHEMVKDDKRKTFFPFCCSRKCLTMAKQKQWALKHNVDQGKTLCPDCGTALFWREFSMSRWDNENSHKKLSLRVRRNSK